MLFTENSVVINGKAYLLSDPEAWVLIGEFLDSILEGKNVNEC
jgi:hypothetical protein